MSSTLHHSVESSTVADLLERILDKGIVISGDIKINLVEVELLSIHIRLLICSIDKAKEIGIDWWEKKEINCMTTFEKRLEKLELLLDQKN